MKVLMPLPDRDFDVTETAVPWKLLTRAGHKVVFATETGAVAACDPLLLTGILFGQLGAEAEPKQFYAEMIASENYRHPLRWDALDMDGFDALWLPGGHAPGMKQYLGSEILQQKVVQFCATKKPLAAICHGVVVMARARVNGISVLHGRKTTCLPKYMERNAYLLTAWRRGKYFRTYPAYVEDEVRAALAAPDDFVRGPRTMLSRGSDSDDRAAFVLEDGNYVSARWPGDAYLLTKKLIERLEGKA